MENTFFRRAIIVFLLSFTILVITSAFYLFLNTKDILLVSDLTADFRDKVYLKDFIYKLDGTLKNNYKTEDEYFDSLFTIIISLKEENAKLIEKYKQI